MSSIQRFKKSFFHLVERFEEVIAAERLRDILQNFLAKNPSWEEIGLVASLVGLLLVAGRLIKGSANDDKDGFVSLNLITPPAMSIESRSVWEFTSELHYFDEFLKDVKRSKAGEDELLECFICPLKGKLLRPPPGTVLPTLARLTSESRISVHYFFIFEKKEFAEIDPDYLQSFLNLYKFARLSLILLDEDIRQRQGVPRHSRINTVTFANQRIAYTHNRDQTGRFTGARKYKGPVAEKYFAALSRLSILAEDREVFTVGNELRAFVSGTKHLVAGTPAHSTTPNIMSVVTIANDGNEDRRS